MEATWPGIRRNRNQDVAKELRYDEKYTSSSKQNQHTQTREKYKFQTLDTRNFIRHFILFILLFHQHSVSQNIKRDKFKLGHNVDRNRQDKTRLGRAL